MRHSVQSPTSSIAFPLGPVSTIPLPFFRCHFAVLRVSRCRFRTPLPLRSISTEFDGNQFPCTRDMDIQFFYITSKKLTINKHIISVPWLVGVKNVAGQLRNNGKIELNPISTEERSLQLFAVYGCKEIKFSYLIFTKQRNFTMVERRNGNERTATEWWKPGIISYVVECSASSSPSAGVAEPRCTLAYSFWCQYRSSDDDRKENQRGIWHLSDEQSAW